MAERRPEDLRKLQAYFKRWRDRYEAMTPDQLAMERPYLRFRGPTLIATYRYQLRASAWQLQAVYVPKNARIVLGWMTRRAWDNAIHKTWDPWSIPGTLTRLVETPPRGGFFAPPVSVHWTIEHEGEQWWADAILYCGENPKGVWHAWIGRERGKVTAQYGPEPSYAVLFRRIDDDIRAA